MGTTTSTVGLIGPIFSPLQKRLELGLRELSARSKLIDINNNPHLLDEYDLGELFDVVVFYPNGTREDWLLVGAAFGVGIPVVLYMPHPMTTAPSALAKLALGICRTDNDLGIVFKTLFPRLAATDVTQAAAALAEVQARYGG